MSVFSLDSFSCFSSSVWMGLDGPEDKLAPWLGDELIAAGDVMLIVSLLSSLCLLNPPRSGYFGIGGAVLINSKSTDFFRNFSGFSNSSRKASTGGGACLVCSGLGLAGFGGTAWTFFVGLVMELERDDVRGLISGGIDRRAADAGGDSIEEFLLLAYK